MAVKVVRIRYAHSDPLFWKARVQAVEAGNLESARLLLDGVADIGFVPITLAAQYGLHIVPRLAIYSVGPIISSRLFKGRGSGGACAVGETTVSARALSALLGLSFKGVDDPWTALDSCSEVLVVGDEALRMADRGVPHVVDVGELWQERVGSPLVFAVLVARPGAPGLEEAVAEMENSVASFYENPGPLIESVARRLSVSKSLVEEYYQRSRYLVNGSVVEAMKREAEILGLPPLRFAQV
ncbi:MAG: MqnA/MqnD/SBP family protein [Thermoproteus sp.]|jgi:predicted solute-binding protein